MTVGDAADDQTTEETAEAAGLLALKAAADESMGAREPAGDVAEPAGAEPAGAAADTSRCRRRR